LEHNGAAFSTETDTEVVAHLVTDEMKRGRSPVEAVEAALPRLRGAFALAFLFAGEEDLLIGARKGSPLAVGYGDGEMDGGSDAIALAPFTDTISYLEDGDWAVVHRKGLEIRNAGGHVVKRDVLKSTASALLVDRGNHRHFMAKEIHEQPEVVGHTLAHYLDMAQEQVRLAAALRRCRAAERSWPARPSRPAAPRIMGAGAASPGPGGSPVSRPRSMSPPIFAPAGPRPPPVPGRSWCRRGGKPPIRSRRSAT